VGLYICVYIYIYIYIHTHTQTRTETHTHISIYLYLLPRKLSNVIFFFPYHSGKASFSEISSTLPVIQNRWPNYHFTWCNLTLMIFLSFKKLCYLLTNLCFFYYYLGSWFSVFWDYRYEPHAQLFFFLLRWSVTNFCLGWPQIATLLISASLSS
jgi:hypothetical protein